MNWQKATAQLEVRGMTCYGCVNSVKNTLEELPGVESASVDLDSGLAEVVYDPARSTPEAMVTAIGQLGYTARAADVGHS